MASHVKEKSSHNPNPGIPCPNHERGTVSQTAALYQLQMLDSQIDVIRKRLAEIADLLGQDDVLRAAQSTLTNAEQAHARWHAQQGQLEAERMAVQEEAKATEERLYSGRVLNPRELTDLQDKLVELNRRIEALEEPTLEAMLAVEEEKQHIENGQRELQRIMSERALRFGELDKEQKSLSSQLDQLLADSTQARTKITSQHLGVYDRLRQRPGGLAVTLLRGEECSVCGVELTSQMAQRVHRGEVLNCPTCDRILHATKLE
jgi:predicted  nucleic acid-binding Zn-ribbon protein